MNASASDFSVATLPEQFTDAWTRWERGLISDGFDELHEHSVKFLFHYSLLDTYSIHSY